MRALYAKSDKHRVSSAIASAACVSRIDHHTLEITQARRADIVRRLPGALEPVEHDRGIAWFCTPIARARRIYRLLAE
jgi:hypothetical protein